MICAIVPAKNEAGNITIVLNHLAQLPIDHILLILNGCRDATLYEALTLSIPHLHIFYFHEALGIDIPRAIGAKIAYTLDADVTLFIDGDMIGNFNENLQNLLNSVQKEHLDLALTNCYPRLPQNIEKCNLTFKLRLKLNEILGLFSTIKLANPAHGPHAVSKRFLHTIPLCELSMPPVTLALAQKKNLNIAIGTTISYEKLGSPIKYGNHTAKVIHTIAGDCLEAIAVYTDKPRNRIYQGQTYIGYHKNRRFDILDEVLSKI